MTEQYFGEAIKEWETRCEEFEQHQENPLSETDLRCKVIDPLLTQILGWDEACIRREPKINAGFIDYYCNSTKNKFIIEAKSTKIDFKMRNNDRYDLVKAGSLKRTSELLHSAIEQGRSYAIEKNCLFAVISNGLNIAVTKTYPDREDHFDTLLISGKEAITKNFHILYEILSPYNEGYKTFNEIIISKKAWRKKPQHTKTLLKELYDPNVNSGGDSSLAQELLPVLKKYFNDIADDKELIENLYCDSHNLDQYGKTLKSFLQGRLPMLGHIMGGVAQIETEGDKLGEFGQDFVKELQMSSQPLTEGHVFVLFGNIGAGKTTFISRFYEHILKGAYKKKLLWIPINFLKYYGDKSEIENYVLKHLESSFGQIEEDLDDFDTLIKIYNPEISRKKKGPWKPFANRPDFLLEKMGEYLEVLMENKKEHIERVLAYIKDQLKYEVCLVFDNLDHHPEEIQEQATSYALTKASIWKILMLISIRDETYWTMKKSAPMNAYANLTAYQIVPPSVDKILIRRIEYIIQKLGRQEVYFDYMNNNGKSVGFSMKFGDIFQLFLDTIKTPYASEFFRNISSGNIRYALDVFYAVAVSNNTNLQNILNYNLADVGERKLIPMDKLIKSVGLSSSVYYDADKSKVANMFQCYNNSAFHSHFINFRVLEVLKAVEDQRFLMDTVPGFIPLGDLQEMLQVYVQDVSELRKVLIPLIERHLVESDIGARKSMDRLYYQKIKCVRLTPAGEYYINHLCKEFQYIELIMFDTLIKRPDIFQKLRENILAINRSKKRVKFREVWQKRFENVEVFLNYLKAEEEEEIILLRNYGINTVGKVIPNIIQDYQQQKKLIESKLQKDSLKKTKTEVR